MIDTDPTPPHGIVRPDDDPCVACHTRPIEHGDLCVVCEGDAQRSDRIQLDASFAPWFIVAATADLVMFEAVA